MRSPPPCQPQSHTPVGKWATATIPPPPALHPGLLGSSRWPGPARVAVVAVPGLAGLRRRSAGRVGRHRYLPDWLDINGHPDDAPDGLLCLDCGLS